MPATPNIVYLVVTFPEGDVNHGPYFLDKLEQKTLLGAGPFKYPVRFEPVAHFDFDAAASAVAPLRKRRQP